MVAYLFLKTVATLPAHYEERSMIDSSRTLLEITIFAALSNALHECEHHLADVREDLRLLGVATH